MWGQAAGAPGVAFLPQATPDFIPTYVSLPDPTGMIGSFQPGGATQTSHNAFFASLGTNGRTCFTCHQPQHAWGFGPETVHATFLLAGPDAPLFAPVDGADCPDLADEVDGIDCDGEGSHLHRGFGTGRYGHFDADAFKAARTQLFSKANIRVFLPIPANAQFKVRVHHDPIGCETSTEFGLPAGFLSMYRRPRPTANVVALEPNVAGGAVFSIMWDGREATLESQFVDATLGHAQAAVAPSAAQQAEGVAFQKGLFTGQDFDDDALSLSSGGAKGGPTYLSTLPPSINGLNFPGAPPAPPEFDVFLAWSYPTGLPKVRAARASIARGEAIFNTRSFTLDNVPGFNDLVGVPSLPGANCTFCHNNVDRGNDFVTIPKRLGIGDNTHDVLPPPPDQPLLSFLCPPGSIPFFSNPVTVNGVHYDELLTTDPGAGLVTGKCSDLGRMTVPILRGLAARAPYFHGGNAATLHDVVDFYDSRFHIGFTDGDKEDLVAFLSSL